MTRFVRHQCVAILSTGEVGIVRQRITDEVLVVGFGRANADWVSPEIRTMVAENLRACSDVEVYNWRNMQGYNGVQTCNGTGARAGGE